MILVHAQPENVQCPRRDRAPPHSDSRRDKALTSCHVLGLFFVSQALKYTTTTTQLLTDMPNDLPTFKSLPATNVMYINTQPTSNSKTVYICTQSTLVLQEGEPQTEACLSVSKCDTSTTSLSNDQLEKLEGLVEKFKSNSTNVTMCRGFD